MEGIARFIERLFNNLIYEVRYRIERKVRDGVSQQLDQIQKPKQKEQAEDSRK